MSTQEIAKSNTFKIAAIVIGVVLVALISFALGLQVGFHKAKFSYQWGENYEKNFMGPGKRMMLMPPGPEGSEGPKMFFKEFDAGRDLRNGHGVAGQIISINENSLVIKDKDEKENTVAVDQETIIKYHRDDLKINELKTDDRVVVIGKPGDDGIINADFIRVFDQNMQDGPLPL